MRKFNITVNGTAYEVEVEEVGAGVASAPRAQAAPVAPPAPRPQAAPAPAAAPAAPKPSATAAAGTEAVKAPMPGTVLQIRASAGQSVKKGDVLIILEAMKMENEIMAARDGVIDVMAVSKGQQVNTGDLICSIK